MDSLPQGLELCDECGACLDVCPVYEATQNEMLSPIARLKTARSIFLGEQVTSEMIDSIYNCFECGSCDSVCPQQINITQIVAHSRLELANREIGPLPGHNKVIEGIQKLGNAANGDPAKRLEWLPEEFPTKESSTLLYLGCLASYAVKECATSSYLALKKLGVDFMLLQDEGCCGTFFYDVGRLDLAREKFEENVDRFKQLGIKKVIVCCAGCYYAFKREYPQLLGHVDFETIHIVELLPSLLKEKGIKPTGKWTRVAYQDPCELGRKEGIYNQPREVIRLCGAEIAEMERNRERALCCGGGGGVRTVYRDLSLKVATRLLNQTTVRPIISACPFCVFTLNYALRKMGRGERINYITEMVLDCLS